jgi:hypothetical protein
MTRYTESMMSLSAIKVDEWQQKLRLLLRGGGQSMTSQLVDSTFGNILVSATSSHGLRVISDASWNYYTRLGLWARPGPH